MFKTKLQEVCHRKKWGLPKYSCIKDGADHNPQFRASVSVNGLSFDSLTAFNSSKHALNDAAKLAFLHFTSDAKPIAEGPEIEETDMSSQIHSNASDVKVGIQYQYKMQLQSFAQAKNLDLPLYSSKREGKPHALQFQATVTIDGHSFESPGYFRTLKEAEHAAAKVALMSLSLDGFQEIDTHFYKNLLQELAQKEGLALPEFQTVKCGLPHKPTFFSNVEVEGEIFHGKGAKSKKLAELSAAKVACTVFAERKSTRGGDLSSSGSSAGEMLKCSPSSLDLLTNANPQQSLKPLCSMGSSPAKENEDVKPIAKGPEIEETDMSSQIHSNASDVKVGIPYQYKMQLQSFAQAKNLNVPLYSSKREGKPHALQFQATVTIDGHSFESPGYFRTLKEAEHAAAKVALMSLSLDGFQEIDTHFYKNLLQELAQKEGLALPEFQTVKCGLPHKPTFFSNVKVEGEIFHGKGAKSKKLAELSAAKVACTVFMECKSTRGGDLSSSGSSAEEMLKCSPNSLDLLTNANPQQSLKPLCSTGSSPAKENEVEEIVSTRDFPVSTKVSLQDTIIASPALLNTEEAQSSSARPPPLDLSALSINASNKQKKTEETKSYLLSNRVRVYTCIPNIAFPEGTVLLPIADCKWVAVSLEFPNKKN